MKGISLLDGAMVKPREWIKLLVIKIIWDKIITTTINREKGEESFYAVITSKLCLQLWDCEI